MLELQYACAASHAHMSMHTYTVTQSLTEPISKVYISVLIERINKDSLEEHIDYAVLTRRLMLSLH
jgi:hypothetical protein